MIKEVEKITSDLDVNKITVETLSEKEDWKLYEQTRAFYIKHGYKLESTRIITSKSSGEKFNLVKYSKNI